MFGPPELVAIERLVGADRLDDAMDDFFSFYETHHSNMANAHEGIVEILDFIKRCGVLLAIFTGKGRRTTLITLDTIGIKNYFDLIVTGDDVSNHKPSAEGIREIMNAFALTHEEVLMVGDAVADVDAAHEAGIPIAAVVWDSYCKEKVVRMNVDYLFHSVEEFAMWLREALPNKGEQIH
jgi:HAD superfamily hydrolase (TIGR01549 family)